MAKGASGLPGFRDFYPEEFAARAHILNAWRDVARRFGFVEYDGPPLEPLDLYTKKSGDEIVGQLYNFKDKGDRDVALRPEMTPTFARMVGARLNALRKPVRWFSIPQLFRYERQQKGRLREHFQLNVDIVGETDVAADAELIAVSVECMRAFGLTSHDVRVRVNDRPLFTSILTANGAEDSQVVKVMGAFDKLDRSDLTAFQIHIQKIGLSTATSSAVVAMSEVRSVSDLDAALKSRALASSDDVEVRRAKLQPYFDHLRALGVDDWVDFDVSIVRGLAYYTGIVFELHDAKNEFRAICGGGRYDTLLASLGGADAPALGFGMGDVVLGELLKARGKMPSLAPTLDYWVAYEDAAQRDKAMQAATALRRKGKSVEYALHHGQLGKQLEAASKAGAARAVILKADGTAVERDLATKAESPFTFVDG